MLEKSPKSTVSPTLFEQWDKARDSFSERPLPMIREGLLLNERAYDVMRNHPSPMRHGFTILGYITVLLLIALVFGLLLAYLTMPQFDILSQRIYDGITQFTWFSRLSTRNPDFATQFQAAYISIWQLIRIYTGYPSLAGAGLSVMVILLSLFGSWLGYGSFAHLFARWFGGQASLRQFLGPLALSYAPMALRGLAFIPGLEVAGIVIFLLMLVTKFIAVRRTYGLTPGYGLAVVIAPYIVGLLLGLVLIVLLIGVGLGQIPYLDPIIRLIQIWPSS